MSFLWYVRVSQNYIYIKKKTLSVVWGGNKKKEKRTREERVESGWFHMKIVWGSGKVYAAK